MISKTSFHLGHLRLHTPGFLHSLEEHSDGTRKALKLFGESHCDQLGYRSWRTLNGAWAKAEVPILPSREIKAAAGSSHRKKNTPTGPLQQATARSFRSDLRSKPVFPEPWGRPI